MSDSIGRSLRKAFGANAGSEGPLASSGAGLRITGVDLSAPLSPEQVAVLLDALAWYRIVTIAGQDLESFSLAHFERFANYWGANDARFIGKSIDAVSGAALAQQPDGVLEEGVESEVHGRGRSYFVN